MQIKKSLYAKRICYKFGSHNDSFPTEKVFVHIIQMYHRFFMKNYFKGRLSLTETVFLFLYSSTLKSFSRHIDFQRNISVFICIYVEWFEKAVNLKMSFFQGNINLSELIV